MTIRYKADPKVQREVERIAATEWVGIYNERYYDSDWEPVPETRWVPCEVVMLAGEMRVLVPGYGDFHLYDKIGVRITNPAPGTVRFEREE